MWSLIDHCLHNIGLFVIIKHIGRTMKGQHRCYPQNKKLCKQLIIKPQKNVGSDGFFYLKSIVLEIIDSMCHV